MTCAVRRRVLVIAAALALLLPMSAKAEESFARALFRDCRDARETLSSLKPDVRREQYPLLVKVLGLNTQAPAVPEAFAVLPDNSHQPEFGPPALWQSVDARRELEAKRCAIDLLNEAGGDAAAVLPELVDLYSSQGFSDEIGVALEELAADIAEKADREGFRPAQSAFESFLLAVSHKYPLVAEAVLTEFYKQSAPRVLLTMATASEDVSKRLARVVKEGDPTGLISSESLAENRELFPPGALQGLLERLPGPSESADTSMIARLVPVAGDPEVALLLGRFCRAAWQLDFTVEEERSLDAQPNLLDNGFIPVPEQECMTRSSVALARRVPILLASPDAAVVDHALTLLPAAYPKLSAEERKGSFDEIGKHLAAPTSAVTAHALASINLFTGRKAETTKFLLEALSRVRSEARSPHTDSLIAALTDTALALGRSEATEKVDDLMFAHLLAGRRVDDAVSWLAPWLSKRVETRFFKLLRLVDLRTAETMVSSLLARANVDPGVLKELIDATERPDLAPIIEREIAVRAYTLGPDTWNILAKATSKPSLSKLILLRALPAPVVKGKVVKAQKAPKPESVPQALATAPCSQLSARGALVAELLQGPAVEQGLVDRTIGCLRDSSIKMATKLGDAAVTERVLASEPMAEFLTSPAAHPEIVESILDAAVRAQISGPLASRLMLLLLENSDTDVRRRVVSSVFVSAASDPAVAAEILRQYQEISADDRVEAWHLIALARVGAPDVEWDKALKRCAVGLAQGERSRFCDRLIEALPESILTNELATFLDDGGQEGRVGAIRLVGLAANKTRELLPRLEQFVSGTDPELRYSAVVAILKIDPVAPGLSEWVRRLLVNRFFDLAKRGEIAWSSTSAVASLDRRTFGILRTSRLSAVMSRNGS